LIHVSRGADSQMESYQAMKTEYLVVFDYGMGGLWAVIRARSKEEIVEKYPFLAVVEDRPKGLTEESLNRISSKHSFDIDDEPTGRLKMLKEHAEQRNQGV
jgi:hypothetical protein